MSHKRKMTATQRKTFERYCSSSYCAVPRGAALGLGSPMLNVDVKNPKGNAPMPKLMWKPPSPNPNPWKPGCSGCSCRCPAGRGGTFLFLLN